VKGEQLNALRGRFAKGFLVSLKTLQRRQDYRQNCGEAGKGQASVEGLVGELPDLIVTRGELVMRLVTGKPQTGSGKDITKKLSSSSRAYLSTEKRAQVRGTLS